VLYALLGGLRWLIFIEIEGKCECDGNRHEKPKVGQKIMVHFWLLDGSQAQEHGEGDQPDKN
jgi:hypothetical protein